LKYANLIELRFYAIMHHISLYFDI